MSFKPKFRYSDIEKAINNDLIAIERGVISILQRVGEEFVSDARSAVNISPGAFPKGDYMDQTANLRSSIGYFILRDNKVISDGLEGTFTGKSAARNVLNEIGSRNGYRLVGVAGMEYASHLEAIGYNVITSQKMVALVNLGERLRKYSKQLSKKGQNIDFEQGFNGISSTLK
jgi:hypothetical protein